jgi:hypothetical protein
MGSPKVAPQGSVDQGFKTVLGCGAKWAKEAGIGQLGAGLGHGTEPWGVDPTHAWVEQGGGAPLMVCPVWQVGGGSALTWEWS